MKRYEISSRNMSDIVTTWIVLHSLCMVNNEKIEDERIFEANNKLARKINEENLQKDGELQREKIGHVEVKRKILASEDVLIVDEVNNVETYLFIRRKIKNANYLLCETIMMH